MWKQRVVAAGLALTLCTFGAQGAAAATEKLTIKGSDTVQSPSGEYRVFFQVADSKRDAQIVRQAWLRVPYAGQETKARSVPLRVMPVTTDWALGSASWTSWTRAGGDFDDELYSDAVLEASRASTAVFDVTVTVKEWKEDGQPLYGFVVTVPLATRDGVSSEDLSLLASIDQAELEIDYMPLVGPRKVSRTKAEATSGRTLGTTAR